MPTSRDTRTRRWNHSIASTEPGPSHGCIKSAFDADLMQLIRSFPAAGTHVVLGLDANTDLNRCTGTPSSTSKSSFRYNMARVGLHETIIEQHGTGPSTTGLILFYQYPMGIIP
eukprot:scaffold43099_cov51-Attheya_sp.AAC.3